MEPGFNPDIPASFSGLEEARHSLDYLLNYYLHVAEDVVSEQRNPQMDGLYDSQAICIMQNNLGMHNCRSLLQQWSDALSVFVEHSGEKLDSKDRQALLRLKINRCVNSLIFDPSLMAYQSVQLNWDKFLTQHDELTSLAASIIEASKSTTDTPPSLAPTFTLDVNIVVPLYSVASRCRDPVLRRKAISLLYSAPYQEGVWNGLLAARVAERLMNLEEAGLGEVKTCKDVPESARVSAVNVDFDLEGRQAFVEFCRQGNDPDTDTEKIRETLRW